MPSPPTRTLVVNRSLDLRDIDAVGFDLDHTLALYDDAAVNAIAMAEAGELLVAKRGYHPRDIAAQPHPGDAAAIRALALDLTHSHIVKLDANRSVRIARHAGTWLAANEVERVHAGRVPERDDVVHPISSPFDAPTLWLFEALTGALAVRPVATTSTEATRVCRDVREMLDFSHTRGDLKQHLVRDLARFVSPVEGTGVRLREWSRAGKRLFVVTNSELAYASEVLDRVVGPDWRRHFSVVVTSAGKPAFFAHAVDRVSPSTRALLSGAPVIMVEGADATTVERLIGVRRDRVLYVGDNPISDIRAARSHGWRTVHVVAEMGAGAFDGTIDGWGSPFAAADQPSWFSRIVGEYADVVVDRVDRLLDEGPEQAFVRAPLEPPSGESA